MQVWHYELETPLGPMWAAFARNGRLRRLGFGGLNPRATMPIAPSSQREAFRFLVLQLDAYFASTLRTFTVPLEPQGSPLDLKIWDRLALIPYGQTRPLAEVAPDLADTQTLAQALDANPIAILIPCHRVILPSSQTLIQQQLQALERRA